jgi:peroxiredoxin
MEQLDCRHAGLAARAIVHLANRGDVVYADFV